jgi:hypothetical protein
MQVFQQTQLGKKYAVAISLAHESRHVDGMHGIVALRIEKKITYTHQYRRAKNMHVFDITSPHTSCANVSKRNCACKWMFTFMHPSMRTYCTYAVLCVHTCMCMMWSCASAYVHSYTHECMFVCMNVLKMYSHANPHAYVHDPQ